MSDTEVMVGKIASQMILLSSFFTVPPHVYLSYRQGNVGKQLQDINASTQDR